MEPQGKECHESAMHTTPTSSEATPRRFCAQARGPPPVSSPLLPERRCWDAPGKRQERASWHKQDRKDRVKAGGVPHCQRHRGTGKATS
jgi:hypothetical protein